MQDCIKCLLNSSSEHFNSALLNKIPLYIRKAFICNQSVIKENIDKTSFNRRNICSRDLWVLTFIGQNDKFALKSAAKTLDKLVKNGDSELLCNLFESANYEARKALWLKMVEEHPDRLYLFNALFEKECLAPVYENKFPENFHYYQHSMLFGNSHTPIAFDAL